MQSIVTIHKPHTHTLKQSHDDDTAVVNCNSKNYTAQSITSVHHCRARSNFENSSCARIDVIASAGFATTIPVVQSLACLP
eukprot:jgi/Psemu1/304465/fgenesh1_kg.153_\